MAPPAKKRGAAAKAATIAQDDTQAEKVATEKPQRPLKKQKTETVVDPLYAAVIDAVQRDESLTEACRDMLVAMVSGCFPAPAGGNGTEERHEHQELVVRMMTEVMDRVSGKCQEAVDAAGAKVTELELSKDALDVKVQEAAAVLATKTQTAEEKQRALARLSQVVLQSRGKVTEAQEACRKGDASLVEAKKSREALEATAAEHLVPLKDGNVEVEAPEAKAHLVALLTLAKQLKLDESLLSALPTACARKPSDRGPFDRMVFEQVEAGLKDKLAEYDAMLAAAGPATEERTAAVEAAKVDQQNVTSEQQQAAQELGIAQIEKRDADAAVKTAQAAVTTWASQNEGAFAARDECAAKLATFQDHNVKCFGQLRDRAALALAAEAAAKSAAAAAAAAAEAAAVEAVEPAPMEVSEKAAAAAAECAPGAVEVAEAGA